MNLRNLLDLIVSSTLALGMIGSLAELGAPSALAQSITATMPFPFCVNNQAYPTGTYRLTLISPWLVSIRNLNGGGERLFSVHPKDLAGPLRSVDGLTFTAFQGLKELKAVHEDGSDVSFELGGQGIPKGKTRGPLKPTSCLIDTSPIRGRNTTGQ
jgi:hypothetical protein